MLWAKVLLIALAVVVVVLAGAALLGTARWQGRTRELRQRLESARVPVSPAAYSARELDGLPEPVQRYFRLVLREGQGIVAGVTVEHRGTFNTSEAGDSWKPFSSTQRVITRRPGFVWDARIAMIPGFPVRVHDAYVAGEGVLHATLLGLIGLAQLRGGGELARGELMRYLAEAAWYPTALLPSQGVRWESVDEHTARATLTDGDVAVTLQFRFDGAGLIESVRADARGRVVGGRTELVPWEGRWSDYALRDGMRVPLTGEVAWLLPAGPKQYWRGRITRLDYERAR